MTGRTIITMLALLALGPAASAAADLVALRAVDLREGAADLYAPVPARAGFDCQGPQYWRNEIAGFLKMDGAGFPPENAFLFMGSSSVRMWDLKKYFQDLPAINRGFGGSCIPESTYYLDKIAVPYRPRSIVFYSGENDIAAARPPETVAVDFEKFMSEINQKLPGVPVIYISIKPSPARWALWPQMRTANALLEASCAGMAGCRFLDTASAMLGEDGKPRPELFRSDDGLHLSDQGYRLWSGLLSPLLRTR